VRHDGDVPTTGGDAPPALPGRLAETDLERFTRLVRRLLDVPVSLVVADPQDLPSLHLAVPVVSWVSMPVVDGEGRTLGHLCAVDQRPRAWSEPEVETLRDLAATCSTELRLVEAELRSSRARAEAEELARHSRLLLALSEALVGPATVDGVTSTVLRVAREVLETGSCGVLLVDHEHARLQPYVSDEDVLDWLPERLAAAGLGEEENPPAQVARTGDPLFVPDLSLLARAEPRITAVFDRQGFRRWAFVPLVTADRRTDGVIALSWPQPRRFSGDERDSLIALGRYAGQALQRARLVEDLGDVARTLQEALLTALPAPEGLEVVARYSPAARAHQVGGDWYDAFVLPDGGTALVIGDVTGHDLGAAAAMGSLRSMLRALAFEHPASPAEAVQRLDRAAAGLGSPPLTTLVCAVIDPPEDAGDGRAVRWTSAGHLPPLLLLPDGRVEELRRSPELLLGVAPETARSDHVTRVPPGAVLLLYTDGLVERRGEDVDAGVARLAAALGRRAGQDPAGVVAGVLADLLTEEAEDDVAVLAVRVVDRGERPFRVLASRSAVLPREAASARRARQLLSAVLAEVAGAPAGDGVSAEAATTAELLVSELSTNAVRYGGGTELGVEATVRTTTGGGALLRVEVTDDSPRLPQPRHAAPTEEGGRGLELVALTASAWGAAGRGPGKVVWFELELSPRRP